MVFAIQNNSKDSWLSWQNEKVRGDLGNDIDSIPTFVPRGVPTLEELRSSVTTDTTPIIIDGQVLVYTE